jgi:5-methylcytosine-specific restriction endonuclease McrA
MKAVDGLKRCSKCGETKAVSEFGKDARHSDGSKSRCKRCCSADTTGWVQTHREHKCLYLKSWRRANPRSWEKWYAANRQEREAYTARYYVASYPARVESYKTNARLRRARMLGASGSFTSGEWRALVAKGSGRCLCCGRTDVTLVRDHVKPLSKGGSNSIDNIQPLCSTCNGRKGKRDWDWRAYALPVTLAPGFVCYRRG